MSSLVDGLLHGVPPWVAYLAVFGLPFLEASVFLGFVFPGETALVLGGVLASQGRASLAVAIPLAVVGAVSGDAVGYYVGHRFGPRLKASRAGRFVGEDRWRVAEEFLRRRGGPAVFIGRFTALLRAIVPTAAGMSRLPYRTFAVWNAAGGTVWAVAYLLVGYFAGESYRSVEKLLGRWALAVTALLVVGAFVLHRVRRRRARSGRSGR